jgi:hypothetical protein
MPRDKLIEAIARFDAANTEDPNQEMIDGRERPKELLYAERMSAWLDRLAPDASDVVRLAVRAQHIRRWSIPRDSYPMDRAGYRKWRIDLGKFHAETAGEILRDVGHDEETVTRVQSLLRKERLKADPEVQLLEDVACLVFLSHYFADFAAKHDDARLVEIVRKTWRKMSTRGQAAARGLALPADLEAILARALGQAG